MKKIVLSAILLITISSKMISQGEANLPFLALPASIQSFGTGWGGVSSVTEDPLGYYFNPAILGSSSKENHISIFAQPTQTEWLKNSSPNTYIRTYGLNIGYNFSKRTNIPLSIGFGYMNNKIEFGSRYNNYENTTAPYDEFHGISLGANLDYIISLSIGITYKHFKSELTDKPIDRPITAASLTGSAIDFGFLAELSSRKIFSESDFWNFNKNVYSPFIEVGLGYSISNIGDEVYYIDEAQKDPIPRTARLGYSIKTGFDFKFENIIVNGFSYTFSAEASDLLIRRDENFKLEYKGLFGDIKPGKNLLNLEGDDDIVVHRGHTFNLFETFYYTIGRFHGSSYHNRQTNGYGFSSDGLFKLLSVNTEEGGLKFIFDHISINYSYAKIFPGSVYETVIDGFSVSYRNLVF